VTFLFTDIQGSTRLWEQQPAFMDAALERHDEILRSEIATCAGSVFATGGDGVAAAFGSAADALASAIRMQRALHAEQWPGRLDLKVRIGLHLGAARERSGDYFGPAVNRAARVMATANGGEILLSAAVREVVKDSLSRGVTLVEMGARRLKGLSRPEHVYGVVADGVTAPALETDGSAPQHGNLLVPTTELVGRSDDVKSLCELLPRRRLVTLIGPGGVGKTRLAIEVGLLSGDEYDDGVWFVDLAALDDADLVPDVVASTLGLRPQPGMATEDAVVDGLRPRRLLLLLDNCEHVIDRAAELASRIARTCNRLSVLATSREPLAIEGEHVWPVRTLEPGLEGVELFVDRAYSAGWAVGPDDGAMLAIESLCEHLDGIPLAIELAAARCRMFSPSELLERLAERLTLLRTTQRGRPPRHHTLGATVEWSYRLLEPNARDLFDSLSVLAGSFDLSGAMNMAGNPASEFEPPDVTELVSALVDRSFVVADRTVHPTRYRLLETLRLYGEQQLEAHGLTQGVRDRHLAYYRDVASGLDRRFRADDVAGAADGFEREWDNLRSAYSWALNNHCADPATALLEATFWYASRWVRAEHSVWVHNALGAGMSSPSLYGMAAYWLLVESDIPAALRMADRGMAEAGDPHHASTTTCWYARSLGLLNSARPQEAREAALQLQKAADDPFELGFGRYAALMSDHTTPGELRQRDAEELLAFATQLVRCCGTTHCSVSVLSKCSTWKP
jgi:predicted ATPase/class 3 adenylate cyclase